MRILIVEDEPRMLELLRTGLYEHGFTVMTAADGEAGLRVAVTHEFDSIVLDIGLPRLDGHSLIQSLRARANLTPVLMLTARDTEDDIIHGLQMGADDYLTKPFSFPELVARLHSITRRGREERDAILSIGELKIDLMRHIATRNGNGIDLTRLEFRLLECLVRRPGVCVPRQELIESLWGAHHPVGPTALDVLVNSLRSKIDVPYRSKLIGTLRGTGYIFTLPEANTRGKS
jgi:DNA-binding response OmpR family regulator